MTRLDTCKRIVARSQHEKIDGMVIDTQTAALLVQVWHKLGTSSDPERFRAAFESAPIDRVARAAWKAAR